MVAPCGYDRAGATALADELVGSGRLPAGVPVHPVDANAAWARPGTRLVDGVEELSALLHPPSASRVRRGRSLAHPGRTPRRAGQPTQNPRPPPNQSPKWSR